MSMITKESLRDLYDYQDGKLFWKVNKGTAKIGDEVGYFTGRYFATKLNGKRQQVSRLIYMYHHGNMPEIVDHINGNTSDNRIENLREATALGNNHNRSIAKNNKSGIKGVFFSNQMNKWKTQITINYKQIHLGYYDDKDLAELVVSEARNKYHKSFACDGRR